MKIQTTEKKIECEHGMKYAYDDYGNAWTTCEHCTVSQEKKGDRGVIEQEQRRSVDEIFSRIFSGTNHTGKVYITEAKEALKSLILSWEELKDDHGVGGNAELIADYRNEVRRDIRNRLNKEFGS